MREINGRGRSVAVIGTRGYPSYYGGFETAVRELAPYLARHGWDVTVYGRKDSVREDDPGRHPDVRSTLTRGIDRQSLSTLSYGLTASIDTLRRRHDAALVMNVANGFYLPALHHRGIPTLVNVDGIEWERGKWSAAARRTFLMGARLTARYATRTVYDSREIARRWEERFGVEGVFIPYGATPRAKELPLEPGLEHRGYVLVVARLVPENSVPEFIAAAANLGDRWPVVVVGSSGYGGPLEAALRALERDQPRVRWLGHVHDDDRLHSLWQHAGAYFHGHSVGGTNPALVQAMALGAPTIARDTPYNREVLEDAGQLVPADPPQIEKQVQALMEDPARQELLSGRAVRRAAEHYCWDDVCRKYAEALGDLVRQRVDACQTAW